MDTSLDTTTASSSAEINPNLRIKIPPECHDPDIVFIPSKAGGVVCTYKGFSYWKQKGDVTKTSRWHCTLCRGSRECPDHCPASLTFKNGGQTVTLNGIHGHPGDPESIAEKKLAADIKRIALERNDARTKDVVDTERRADRETHIAAAARLFDVEIAVFNDQLNTWRLYTPTMNTPKEASQDKSKFCVPILLHGEVHFELITSLKHIVP